MNLRYQVDLNNLTLLVPEGRRFLVCLFVLYQYILYVLILQCNELKRGHPTFFYQSQDEFRTKESEYVHFGPITNEGVTAKRQTKYLLNGATKNVGWPRLSSLHFKCW